jgi:hypothetical protein
MKTFKKKVKKENLYKEYVQIINGVLQLSFRETEVLSLLLKLNDELSSLIKETGNVLSTDIRRMIMKETRVSKSNLVKYINTLAEKDILVKKENNKWSINDTFVPSTVGGINEIVFILDTR